MSIPFNKPYLTGKEAFALQACIRENAFSGAGVYARRCQDALCNLTGAPKAIFTPSCTAALEMMALLSGIGPGDEVIMPSFTFVSTANAFVLRGARIVFVDIRPGTMNLDERLLEAAITPRTRAIVVMHYAGIGCRMEAIMEVAARHGLWVFEDAAQCIGADYRGNALGTWGHAGAFSFHDTKNIHCGEGGALLFTENTPTEWLQKAETIRDKGTNRAAFFRGEVDKYTWVSVGGSYLAPEFSAAWLEVQLADTAAVTRRRLELYRQYLDRLTPLAENGHIELPEVPDDCGHNAHIFFIKCRDIIERTHLMRHLRERGIGSAFHYVPLHDAPAGRAFGRFSGTDHHTTRESERLLRLPIYPDLTDAEVATVCGVVADFYDVGF